MRAQHGLGRRADTIKSILVILPSLILIGIFVYGFIGNTIYVSLTDWGRGAGLAERPVKNFVGLENYVQLFTGFIHARFRQDFVNAIFYTLFVLAGTLGLGLLLAVLLDRTVRADALFKTVFLYPMALSFIVSGTIWRWLLAPSGGINLLPTVFGAEKWNFLWISSRDTVLSFNWQRFPQIVLIVLSVIFTALLLRTALTRKSVHSRGRILRFAALALAGWLLVLLFGRIREAVLPYPEPHGFNLATLGIIIAAVWQYSGYTMAMFLAGLQGLPAGIRESARIDGAGEIKYYWHIAIPNLRSITFSAVIMLSHISLKMFDLIFAMAGADNANTGHPSVNMYLTTFRANNFAVGAGIAVIMFVLAALLIIPYLIHSYRERAGL
jgi:glucose/mannose transport system permease protein